MEAFLFLLLGFAVASNVLVKGVQDEDDEDTCLVEVTITNHDCWNSGYWNRLRVHRREAHNDRNNGDTGFQVNYMINPDYNGFIGFDAAVTTWNEYNNQYTVDYSGGDIDYFIDYDAGFQQYFFRFYLEMNVDQVYWLEDDIINPYIVIDHEDNCNLGSTFPDYNNDNWYNQ